MGATTSAGSPPAAQATPCAFCAAPLQDDQEWCLECGVARTMLHRASVPLLPVLAAGAVVTAAIVVFLIALTNLGTVPAPPARVVLHLPGRAAAGRHTAVRAAAATTTGTGIRASGISSWPPGLSGWTVALATTPDQVVAGRDARSLAAGGLTGIGVLDTSQHPHMHAGDWIVFSHRYPNAAAAAAAAARLAAAGHTGAYPIEVAPPGGI